uniref:Uncharacterized protein n=1 Tax=viral metagenome TaxID=1070528 RepID=A0A6H1ZF91_9ZZZZ
MTPLAFFLKYSPEVVKFIAGIFKGRKKAKELQDEKDFVKAVRDGDVDKINEGLHK